MCHILNLNKFIDFYFDSNKHLQGYNFPGTSSKILNPYKYSKSTDICLTCANYSNEKKIKNNNKNIFKKYPKFISLIMTNKKGIKKFCKMSSVLIVGGDSKIGKYLANFLKKKV